jgi:tight adherence protein C
MNTALLGGLLGGLAAAGLVSAVLASPPMRRPTLADRIAPYLADTANQSQLWPVVDLVGGFPLLVAWLIDRLVRFLR